MFTNSRLFGFVVFLLIDKNLQVFSSSSLDNTGGRVLGVKKFAENSFIIVSSTSVELIKISSNEPTKIDSKSVNLSTVTRLDIDIVQNSGVLLCSKDLPNFSCLFIPVIDNKFQNQTTIKLFDHEYETFSLVSHEHLQSHQTDLFYAYTWKSSLNTKALNTTIVRRTLNDETVKDEAMDFKDLVESFTDTLSIENIYGFQFDGFAYFLRNANRKNRAAPGPNINERVVKLTRICLGDRKSIDLRSLHSAPLGFGDSGLWNNSRATAATFDVGSSTLYVVAHDLNNGKSERKTYMYEYDMKKIAEAFKNDYVACYTSEHAWNVALLEPEKTPSLCSIYEMFTEKHKPCHYDMCTPEYCLLDARYYLESYRHVDGHLVLGIDLNVGAEVRHLETYNQLAHFATSDGNFFVVDLNSTNATVVFQTKFDNSGSASNMFAVDEGKKLILLANGSNVSKTNLACNMFQTCQQSALARRLSSRFETCGWCLDNERRFGSTKEECVQPMGVFLKDTCPPLIECVSPLELLLSNSTVVYISGNFSNEYNMSSIDICGSPCVPISVDPTTIVCEVNPPFKMNTKSCGLKMHVVLKEHPFSGFSHSVLPLCEAQFHYADFVSVAPIISILPNWAVVAIVLLGSICAVVAFLLFVRRCLSNKKYGSVGSHSPWYTMIPIRDHAHEHRYGPSPPRQMAQNQGDDRYSGPSYDDLSFLVPNEIRIPRESINKQELVGAGHFGEVYKAFYLNPQGVLTVVAVKTLPRKTHFIGARNVRVFVEEGIRMEVFKHPNVLSLVGISFNEHNYPMIVTPFMAHGDLLSYVRNELNTPTVRQLLNWAVDIAEGLNYLHQLKFIHRDLAARNCMLDEEYRVKVADFGLSRDVYETEFYTSLRPDADIPIKWLPPESVERREFTPKSDIWSYGVTFWELLTRGSEPYAGMSGFQTLEFLKSGRRLEKPTYCPDEIYKLMELCWLRRPHDRPDCIDICVRLPSIIRMLESNCPNYYNMTAPIYPPASSTSEIDV